MSATYQRFQSARKEEQAKTIENQMVSTLDPVSPNSTKTILTHSSRYVPSVKAPDTGHHRTHPQNISNLFHSCQTYPKSLEPFHLSKSENSFRPTRLPIPLSPNNSISTIKTTHDNLNTSSPNNQLIQYSDHKLVEENLITTNRFPVHMQEKSYHWLTLWTKEKQTSKTKTFLYCLCTASTPTSCNWSRTCNAWRKSINYCRHRSGKGCHHT